MDKGSTSVSVVIGESVCDCVFYSEGAGWDGGFFLQLSMWDEPHKKSEGNNSRVSSQN